MKTHTKKAIEHAKELAKRKDLLFLTEKPQTSFSEWVFNIEEGEVLVGELVDIDIKTGMVRSEGANKGRPYAVLTGKFSIVSSDNKEQIVTCKVSDNDLKLIVGNNVHMNLKRTSWTDKEGNTYPLFNVEHIAKEKKQVAVTEEVTEESI